MAKINLPTITSGYNLTKLNEALQQIEDEFNDKVLYRDNPEGEDNSLQSDIDFNSKKILNLPTPTSSSEPIRNQEWEQTVEASESARDRAEAAAEETEALLLSRGDIRNTGDYATAFNYLVSDLFKASTGTWYVAQEPFLSTNEVTDTDISNGNVKVWQGITIIDGELHDTLAGAKSRVDVVEGSSIRITDRGDALFDYVTGATADTHRILDHDTLSLQLQLRVGSKEVYPEQFGAVADGVTNDTNAVQAAFTYAGLNSLDIVGGSGTSLVGNITSDFDGNIRNLKLKALSVNEYLLRLTTESDLHVKDSEFDGDTLAAKLLYIRNTSALVAPDVLVENCKTVNFAQSASTGQAAGVQVQGRFKSARVVNSNVDIGTSTHGSPIVRGVTFEPDGTNGESPQVASVEGGSISNVQATADADGVNFTLPTGGDLERYTLNVRGVDFTNCSKRSVKSQVRNGVVKGNSFRFEGTPVGPRFAEVEFQQGGGVCASNKFFTDCDQTTGFRFVQGSDDDSLTENNATIITDNNITSIQGDEFVFSLVTDDATTPARTLKGNQIKDNSYNGVTQYFCQLNPVAHGAGSSTTIIDNLQLSGNQATSVTGALIWHGRRAGPSSSSRVRLSVHDNMHGDAATVSVPLIFENTTNLSRAYIKDADNTNFDAGV